MKRFNVIWLSICTKMKNQILGLHHITAISSNAQKNYDFYTKFLGQRLVKRTVNFDDPNTYHFYFGDKIGTPGTIITFFPWEKMSLGKIGNAMATEIGFSVNKSSYDFWLGRLKEFNVPHSPVETYFGKDIIRFQDDDRLAFSLVFTDELMNVEPWESNGVAKPDTTRGFNNVVLTLRTIDATAAVLSDLLGYTEIVTENDVTRLNNHNDRFSFIDLKSNPLGKNGQVAAGNVHHIAFEVKDESILMEYREKIASAGLHITEKIDRDYFYSIYFREPGGVLFELATQNPGFDKDESISELGQNLQLPSQYESMRSKISGQLPVLTL